MSSRIRSAIAGSAQMVGRLMLDGLRVVQSMLAVSVRVEFTVEPWPGASHKKRRRWFVKRTVIETPGCIVAGGVVYVHPKVMARLRAEV